MITKTMWALYFVGQLLHMFKRIDMTKSSKLNGIKTYGDYLKANWISLATRLFLSTMLLGWWSTHADFLNTLFSRFGVTVGFEIPFTLWTVGIYGLAIDSILDWMVGKIPFLQKEVPPNP